MLSGADAGAHTVRCGRVFIGLGCANSCPGGALLSIMTKPCCVGTHALTRARRSRSLRRVRAQCGEPNKPWETSPSQARLPHVLRTPALALQRCIVCTCGSACSQAVWWGAERPLRRKPLRSGGTPRTPRTVPVWKKGAPPLLVLGKSRLWRCSASARPKRLLHNSDISRTRPKRAVTWLGSPTLGVSWAPPTAARAAYGPNMVARAWRRHARAPPGPCAASQHGHGVEWGFATRTPRHPRHHPRPPRSRAHRGACSAPAGSASGGAAPHDDWMVSEAPPHGRGHGEPARHSPPPAAPAAHSLQSVGTLRATAVAKLERRAKKTSCIYNSQHH